MDIEEVKRRALQRLKEEQFEQAVKEEIIRLKTKKSLWDKIFPYRIKLERK